MSQEIQNTESCSTQKKCCLCHKILGLKGLSNIYKVLSVLPLLAMIYVLIKGWIEIKTGIGRGQWTVMDGLLWSLQIIITYSFYSLILFTISRVLKVLKKIKHAVCNK